MSRRRTSMVAAVTATSRRQAESLARQLDYWLLQLREDDEPSVRGSVWTIYADGRQIVNETRKGSEK